MLRVVFVLSLAVNIIACSSTAEWKGQYKSDEDEFSSALEVPPGLSQPTVSDSLAVPNISASGSYSSYTKTDTSSGKVTPANPAGVKVIRDGIHQWLEIKATADSAWPQLRAFFNKVGFKVEREDKALGVMETNWLENRASLPTNWFSKLLARISSTGLRDKYRARVEKTGKPGVTRVFITHQGMKEYATDEVNGVKIWWQMRPSDPELEAEMYQRFLVFKGMDKNQAITIASQAKPSEQTRIFEKDGTKMLQVAEGFARTWRRVGIALDRIGLLIDDRDRSAGVYYVKVSNDFRDKIQDKENTGWFANLFSGDKIKLRKRYLLSVNKSGDKTVISIVEPTGAKADARFVKYLLTEIKSYLD